MLKNYTKKAKNLVKEVTERASDVIDTSSSQGSKFIHAISKKVPNPIGDIKHLKQKEKEINQLITQANEKIEPMRVEVNKKLEEFGQLKVDVIDTTLREFNELIQRIEHVPFHEMPSKDIQEETFSFDKKSFEELNQSVFNIKEFTKSGITLIPTVSYLALKGKSNYDKNIKIINEQYEKAMTFYTNTDKVIEEFNVLIQFINNAMSLMKIYNKECIKLNKQTDHIINEIGRDYQKFNVQQKQLIKQHTHYISNMFILLNSSIINDDGQMNSSFIDCIKATDHFLKNAKPIEFVEYKKSRRLTGFLQVLVFLLGALFVYYFLLQFSQ